MQALTLPGPTRRSPRGRQRCGLTRGMLELCLDGTMVTSRIYQLSSSPLGLFRYQFLEGTLWLKTPRSCCPLLRRGRRLDSKWMLQTSWPSSSSSSSWGGDMQQQWPSNSWTWSTSPSCSSSWTTPASSSTWTNYSTTVNDRGATSSSGSTQSWWATSWTTPTPESTCLDEEISLRITGG